MLGWIANAVILVAIVMLGRKKRLGWVFSVVGNLLWCVYAVQIENGPALFIDGLTLCLAAYNWWIWNNHA